ncbi:hypothetical protein [Streptomyces sp. NPDC007905]|uniref:hypothetical protein n=1 Tax=Streptomyces sp. NPDC007905 TaxID=3364788 RepID=UPI0036E5E6D1
MTSENVAEDEAVESAAEVSTKAVDDQLIAELVSRVQAEGLRLTGEGGLLQQLTKRLLESALEDEITDHLGYGKHDPAGKDGCNSPARQDSGGVRADAEIVLNEAGRGVLASTVVRKGLSPPARAGQHTCSASCRPETKYHGGIVGAGALRTLPLAGELIVTDQPGRGPLRTRT